MEELFTKAELVSFGNYLLKLGEAAKEAGENLGRVKVVSDADIENWKTEQGLNAEAEKRTE